MPLAVALWGVAALLCLSVLGLLVCRFRVGSVVVYASCLAVSLVVLTVAALQLLGNAAAPTAWLPVGLPWIGAHFRMDALAALFLAIVNLGVAGASLFALGYGRHETSPGRVLPFYPAFLAGMNLVILAADAFTFLVAWEFMSLTSWALVMAYHQDPENRRAGYVYIMMASFGTLALLLAFGLLAGPDGRYVFADMAGVERAAWVPGLVLALVLLGAGSKAGLVPLHVWLPLAHPAAPSHVSALMSGVMTKVAVYAFVRIVFDLMASPAWWWSIVVLAVGSITAVLGVLSALMQRDLKRLLAYSTIENIGIVFIGLGLALAFKANGMAAAAALAFTAALLHALNHSLFKSLLFFGAGAVLNATGERDIEKMGGLIHAMPQTAFLVLGGCLAISALPPLNGFVSEWLVFQAILLSPDLPQWGLKLMVPAVGAMLALGAALSAACFVRAYGIAFLGRPRSPVAAAARGDRHLLARCHGYHACPVPAARLGARYRHRRPGAGRAAAGGAGDAGAEPASPGCRSCRWPRAAAPTTACWCSSSSPFPRCSRSRSSIALPRARVRRAPAWDCGYPDPSPATQYTADSFAQPIRRVFGPVAFQARESVDMPLPGDVRPARLTVTLRDLAWDMIYAPIGAAVWVAAEKLNHLQFLTIRQVPEPGVRGARRAAAGDLHMALIHSLAVQGVQMLLVLLLAPLLLAFTRKVKARLLRRRGPPLLQGYRDLIRLMRKEVVLAQNASWLFRSGPYMVFAATWVAAALVPTFATGLKFSWTADLIAITALIASARFFLALLGMDVGTSFGGIGSSREMMFASLAEPAMIMIAFTLALVAGSTQLSVIAQFMLTHTSLRVSLGLALAALVIVALAENARIPVDNPATHLELTMVHEAMVLEYSGRHLAVLEFAAALKLLLYLSLIGCIFVPWGLAPAGSSLGGYAVGMAAYLGKLAVGGFLLVLLETSIAKMRVFRVPEFLGIALMLGLLGTLLRFVSRSF